MTRKKIMPWGGKIASHAVALLLLQQGVTPFFALGQTGGAGAAVSSQTRQDMQLREQVKETDPMSGKGAVVEETVTARPLSQDLGDVQIMTKSEHKPAFFLTVDTQAFYNSNVLYAESANLKFGAWQIITTPEIGFAPKIQDEQYSMFFPRAGFRYQFFTYAQGEPYPPDVAAASTTRPYTIATLNFRVSNPYLSLGWAFADDLYLEFSGQANIYTSNSPYSPSANFLNEYPLAWQATWFQPFADINTFTITGRASYVLANPTNFSRTDNNLTLAWAANPLPELSTQLYASFRLAKYTGLNPTLADNPGSTLGYFANDDRLDFQMTYGASFTWTPLENVSVRAFLSWTKSDSSVAEAQTGDFEAFNAGTGLNLIYRF